MRKQMWGTVMVVAMAALALAGGQAAAQTRDEKAAAPMLPSTPVRVQVVLSRYQGEKKVSSMPFDLLVNADDNRMSQASANLRMGIDVPIGSSTTTQSNTTPTGSSDRAGSVTQGTTRTVTQYRNVGTDIDARVSRIDETRFKVYVSIQDSSIYPPNSNGAEAPAFRTFSTGNTVTMRDGETILFGTATDKVTGELLKVEVTLIVVK